MKITCLCCTYGRPKLLGQMLTCFLAQTHQDRRLLILDDAGQYPGQEGDRWRLVSRALRFPSLGEKRNALFQLIDDDTDAVAVWDDDDLYLPWQLDATARALAYSDWSRPSRVCQPNEDWTLRQHLTGGLYHGGMAYAPDLFRRSGGYPPTSGPEDQGLFRRMEALSPRIGDPCEDPAALPGYVFRWSQTASWHISGMGQSGYELLGTGVFPPAVLEPLPVPFDLYNPTIIPEVLARPF